MCVFSGDRNNIFSKFNLKCIFFNKENNELICVLTYKNNMVEKINLKKDKVKRNLKIALLKLYKFSKI